MALGLGMYELSFLSGQDALKIREMFLQKIMFKIQRSRIIGGTQIITKRRKIHLFDKIILFSMQFSAVLNIFIVKT